MTTGMNCVDDAMLFVFPLKLMKTANNNKTLKFNNICVLVCQWASINFVGFDTCFSCTNVCGRLPRDWRVLRGGWRMQVSFMLHVSSHVVQTSFAS